MDKFVADLNGYLKDYEDKLLRVAKQSAQDMIEDAQTPVAKGGDMPVDTGTLRNSLVSEVNGGIRGTGDNSYLLAIAGLQIGDVLSVAWTADYAVHRHYMVGVGQGGGMWRDNAANKWQSIVEGNARKVR